MNGQRCSGLLAALLLVFGLCLTVFMSGCGAQKEQPAKTSAGNAQVDVIRLPGGDWGHPTPYAHYSRGPGYYKMKLVFDSLLEKDEKGLIPWLAEKWDISPDGKTYTFYLRQGVKWHDGKPLTAQDVAFTLEYARKFPPVWGFDASLIKKVEVLDPQKVQIELTQPMATFLEKMAQLAIIPEHIWKEVGDPYNFTKPEAAIGTGPYKLTAYSKEHGTYKFEANENFWGPKPRVKVLEFIPVSDEMLAFEQGQIAMASVPLDLLSRFEGKPEYKVVRQPGFWGYEMIFNMKKNPILASREVRQAFAYAIDRKELVQKLARGAALPGNPGILSPDHVWYNPDVPQYEYSPEKARELLEKAGFKYQDGTGVRKNEKGERLSFQLLISGGEARMAELIKQRLQEVGIEVRVVSADTKTRDARVKDGDFEIAINGHGGWGQDADFLREKFGGSGLGIQGATHSRPVTGYQNPEVDRLATAQLKETDPEKRRKLIQELQRVLAEDVPCLPLYYTTGYSVYRPSEYDGWMFMYDHHALTHSKLSYLAR